MKSFHKLSTPIPYSQRCFTIPFSLSLSPLPLCPICLFVCWSIYQLIYHISIPKCFNVHFQYNTIQYNYWEINVDVILLAPIFPIFSHYVLYIKILFNLIHKHMLHLVVISLDSLYLSLSLAFLA